MGVNILVAHGGGPTAVINTSLQGVVEGARQSGKVDKIYAARFGAEGILKGDLIDLADVQFCARIHLVQIVFCYGKHTACSTRRVIDGFGNRFASKEITIIVEQDVNHQFNNFTGSIMLSCILVVRLGESTDDLFEYVTHLKIGDVVWMQIA